MKVTELVKWLDKHKCDENYQHKNLTSKEFNDQAQLAFDKLKAEQQSKVIKLCVAYGVMKNEQDAEGYALMIRSRYMAQTNLFALCKLLEKYKDVSERKYEFIDGKWHNTHEEICNDFFVRKDPTRATFKQFAVEYTKEGHYKERLLLVPRGGFKSSMDMADTVQWIICFPEVTCLILTGVLDLAKDFVKEIKDFFTLEDGAVPSGEQGITPSLFSSGSLQCRPKTRADGSTLLFQVLFPEHCIEKDDGKSYEFQTPACSQPDKECTVFAASIEQNLAGWHVGIMKLDDVVTNENSRTVDRIKNINKQVSINAAMMHPYGFFDKIGTWYDADDTYGQDMKLVEKCKKEGEPVKIKVYLRAAWWANKAARAQGKVESEMTPADWDLWFPHDDSGTPQLSYEFLRGKKFGDADGFAIKYLNDPAQVHRVKFPRELLIRRTITSAAMPQQGMIVTCVDAAYSTKSWADYTVILTALIYGGRFYIIDMVRGRFNEFEQPIKIAEVAYKWKPKRICVEETMGVKYIARESYREMDKLRMRVPIEFVSLGKGAKSTAKDAKAKPVLRLLGDERLLFTNQCQGLDELYTELSNFGTAAGTHDDIVSALSILVDVFGAYAEMEGQMTKSNPNFIANQQTKDHYDAVYGNGVFSKMYTQKSWNAMAEMAGADPSMSPQQAAKSVGVNVGSSAMTPDADPLADAGLYD